MTAFLTEYKPPESNSIVLGLSHGEYQRRFEINLDGAENARMNPQAWVASILPQFKFQITKRFTVAGIRYYIEESTPTWVYHHTPGSEREKCFEDYETPEKLMPF